MALFELLHHIGRDGAAQLSATLDGQPVYHTELHFPRLDLVGQQGLERVLRHAGDHRADTVAAAHADDELVKLCIVNKVILCFHIRDARKLAFYHCFKFIQNGLVDRHNGVLLIPLILF